MDINHDGMEDRLPLINNENHNNFTSVVALTRKGCVTMVLVTHAKIEEFFPSKKKNKK